MFTKGPFVVNSPLSSLVHLIVTITLIFLIYKSHTYLRCFFLYGKNQVPLCKAIEMFSKDLTIEYKLICYKLDTHATLVFTNVI